MNLKTHLSVLFLLLMFSLASSQDNNPKFRFFGFADMSFHKYFFKENAVIQAKNEFSNKFEYSFDHLNLYSDFSPNNKLRMLFEIGYEHIPNYLQYSRGRILSVSGQPDDTLIPAIPSPSDQNGGKELFNIERAILQLKLNQYARLSFGKFVTPAGIWNVDHGSPVILTSRQPTQFSIVEIYPKAQTGIMEEGNLFLGDVDLSYCVYASTGRNEIHIENPKDVAVGGQLICNLPFLDEFRIGATAYTGILKESIEYMHITIDKDAIDKTSAQALTELQAGLISMEDVPSRIQQLISEEAQKPENFKFVTANLSKSREEIFGVDLRLYKNRIGLQSELNFKKTRNQLAGKDGPDYVGVYGLLFVDAIKKLNFQLTPYFLYERVNIKNSPSEVLSMSSGYNLIMSGINARFFTNFGIKLEFDYLDIITDGILSDYQKNSDSPGLAGQFYISF